MKFQTEAELVKLLKSKIKNTFQERNIEVFEEVSLGLGIADIVVSEIKSKITYGTSQWQELGDLEIHILNLIDKNNNISLISILAIAKIQKYTVVKALKRLIELEYLNEYDSVFSINKEYEFVFKNNFAIEAKLKNWKRALMQAYRYRWFAEYSYVVLDAHFSKPAIKNQSWFEKYNVGLATINTSGELIRHYNPIKQKPFDIKMQMLLSEKVKSQLALSKKDFQVLK